MASILGHFELDFSKPYRQMDLFASDSFFFFSAKTILFLKLNDNYFGVDTI